MITDKNFKTFTILTGLPDDGIFLIRQHGAVMIIERENILCSDNEELKAEVAKGKKRHPEIDKLFRAVIGIMTMATDAKGEYTRKVATSMIFDVVLVLENVKFKRNKKSTGN